MFNSPDHFSQANLLAYSPQFDGVEALFQVVKHYVLASAFPRGNTHPCLKGNTWG